MDTIAAVDIGHAQKLLHLIYAWTTNLGKRKEFSDTLENLRTITHADHVTVFRKCRVTQRRICIAGKNALHGKAYTGAGQMLSDDLLGQDLYLLRKGEVHRMTEALGLSASQFLAKTGYCEIIVCVLERHDETIDLLEVQYRSPPLKHHVLLLQIQAPTLATAWERRHSGSVRAMVKGNQLRVVDNVGFHKTEKPTDILSTDNPMRLTRAEFRICSLIQEGMMPCELLEKLQISQNTFRSHMRSIYLKTGARGQMELLHMLHGRLSA